MTTSAHTAILAQETALSGIAQSEGYQTDLGAALIPSPEQPDTENPEDAIYRAGPIGMDQGANAEMFRMEVTWSALVVGTPAQLDELVLDAQSDLVRALSTICGCVQVRRLDIPARDPGSSSMIASVAISSTIQEDNV